MTTRPLNEAIAEATVTVGNSGAFPPSFDGSRLLFALALFALIWVTAISIALLWKSASDVRARPTPWHEPLGVSRLIEAGWLMTIVMGAGPDVLVMLAWGEVSDWFIQNLLAVDKAFDLLCAVPFTFACWLRVRAGAVIGYQLIRQPIPMELMPTLAMLSDKLRIAALVALIAAGVAIGK